MFNENSIYKMVTGAYKKLKNYYYYDKSLLHMKKKIAEFEYSKEFFDSSINSLVNNVVSEDTDYFTKLIDEIDFFVLPKSMTSCDTEFQCIKSSSGKNKNIEKINFFIDAPIQLLIIDVLWALFIGKISDDNRLISNSSYANKFKKSVFNDSENIETGICFKSNRLFQPYFKLYSKWRDNAFLSLELSSQVQRFIEKDFMRGFPT